MKKVLVSGLLAICVIALAQNQASAWINTRFGVGFDWSYQSGGNNCLWGAWRNGQPPGPEYFGSNQGHGHHHGHYYSHSHHHAQMPIEMPMAQPAYAQPTMSYSPYQHTNYPAPVYYYYGR